jgi:hypothetical protein
MFSRLKAHQFWINAANDSWKHWPHIYPRVSGSVPYRDRE